MLEGTKNKEIGKEEYTYLHYIKENSFSCINYNLIAKETRKNKILSKVAIFLKNNWPNKKMIDEEFRPYLIRKEQLTIEQDCLMWSYRVIVPEKLKNVIEELHETRGHS